RAYISLTLLAGATGFAQTASVNGVVTDSSQAVISETTVSITNIETGLRRDTHTNETGNYTFNLLPVDRYKLAAVMAGFSTETLPEVKLNVDQVARLDFVLKPGALTETVEVSATTTLLDSETTTVGQVITNKEIVEMPLNSRNYLSLATLAAETSVN